MMVWTKGLLLFLCVTMVTLVACQGNEAFEGCGGDITNSTGTVNGLAPVNQTCTWTIRGSGNSSKSTMLFFSEVDLLGDNCTLAVYEVHADNTSALIALFQVQQDPVTVVSFANVTRIVLKRGSVQVSSSSFTLQYNTQECSWVAGQSSLHGEVSSPYYLPNTGLLDCTITVDVPASQDLLVLAFTNFSLPDNAMSLKTNQTKISFTANPDDVYLEKGVSQFQLRLVLQKHNQSFSFRLSYFNVDPACSGPQPLKDSSVLFTLPSVSYPAFCHALVSTSAVNTTLAVKTVSTASQWPGVVTCHDGGSSRSAVIGQYRGGSNTSAVFLSSGTKMVIETRIQQYTESAALMILTQKTGGLVKLTGQTTLSLSFRTEYTFPIWYQVQAPANQQVRFDLSGSALKANDSSVSVYDGLLISNLLLQFTNGSSYFPTTSSTNLLLISVEKLSINDSLQVTLSPTANDCNMFSRESEGTMTWSTKPNGTAACTWVIKPDTPSSVTMVQLERVTLCAGSNLTVLEGLAVKSPVLAVYNTSGRILAPLPTFQVLSSTGLRLQLTSCNMSSSQVSARFWTQDAGSVCGQPKLGQTGSLSSPGYPDMYPLNALCSWTVPKVNQSMLLVTFNSVNLFNPHNVTLLEGNTSKKAMNGSTLPPVDWLFPNVNLSLAFSSVALGVGKAGQGFSLDFKLLTCGGMLGNSNDTVNVPQPSNGTQECVWIIQLPSPPPKGMNSSVNITFNANLPKGYKLTLRDGGSKRSPVLPLDLSKNKTALSRTRYLWINITLNGSTESQQLGEKANVTFTFSYKQFLCDKDKQCANTGLCIHPDWVCNGHNDCGDNTDEMNCRPRPTPSPKRGKSSGVASYWIGLCLLFGLILGIVLAFLVPAIYRRVRYPHYSHLREPNVAA